MIVMGPLKRTVLVFMLMSFILGNSSVMCALQDVPKEEYDLPKIFDFVETQKCPKDQRYCKLNIRLTPVNQENSSTMWKTIQKVNGRDEIFYSRDLIYRALCIGYNETDVQYNEYKNQELVGNIVDSYCVEDLKFVNLVDKIDIFYGCALLSYICLILYSTLKTYLKKTNEKENGYIDIFSIISTWNDLRRPNRNEDFNNLLFFQGIRVIAMTLIIVGHNFMLLMVLFSNNPEYLEEFLLHPLKRILTGSFGLTVQVFFVISSWLHALQLHNLERNNKSVTAKDVFVILLNRYFRLIPPVIIIILAQRSAIPTHFANPLYQSHYLAEQTRCMNGWWKNLLLVQNLPTFEGKACLPFTWFIAADSQLFLLATVSFYLSRKFKISLKHFSAAAIGTTVCIQVYTMFTSNPGGLFGMNPRALPLEHSFASPEILVKYLSTTNHVATYVIGFIFGTFYAEYKKKEIFDTPMKKLLWYAAFCGLPLITSLLHSYKYPKILDLLMAISLRPAFSFGIAVGFLGMASKIGGFIRKVLQWEPLVLLGNFNYSVYMFHFLIVYGKFANFSEMVVLTDTLYLRNLATDIISSYAFGIVMYFIVENPFLQLQKKILPQLRHSRKKSQDKSH